MCLATEGISIAFEELTEARWLGPNGVRHRAEFGGAGRRWNGQTPCLKKQCLSPVSLKITNHIIAHFRLLC